MTDTPPTSGTPRYLHDAMACRFGIQFAGADEVYARRAARAAFDEVDRLEQLLSRHLADSEIAQINRARPGDAVPISPDTIACLHIAAQAHAATHAAFDIAYRSRPHAPRDAHGQPLTPLLYDPHRRAIGVQYENVDLDLGALGKGFAIDRIVEVLHEWHIPAALIDSGQSTVYALGTPTPHENWRVQLRGPDQQPAPFGAVTLHNEALSGSGQVLHGPHIRNPHTGEPVSATRAAWIQTPSAAWSDALSTACMLLSEAEIAALCDAHPPTAAILHTQSPAGERQWWRYPGP